jgi:hypothetical protein
MNDDAIDQLKVAVREHCDKLDAIVDRLQKAIEMPMTDRRTLKTIRGELSQAITTNLHVMVTCS